MNRTSDIADMADPPGVSMRARLNRDAAFRELADVHLDRAYGLARAILRDHADAHDATHDAFVQAWHKWSTLRDPARFERWFDRILVNTCRNRLRSRTRLAGDISVEVARAAGDHVTEAENRDVLEAALAALSPDHQVVVALRFYRDLSAADIANRLGIAEGTVRSRLHYALKQLHVALRAADARGVSHD